MTTITEFIEARLAEDEAIANEAGTGKQARWAFDPDDRYTYGEVFAPDAVHVHRYGMPGHERETRTHNLITCDREGLMPAVEPEQAHHIARHDPDRALRQATAIRAMIEVHRTRIQQGWGHHAAEEMLGADLAPLAAIWADHPDYRQEWESRRA